MTNSFSYKSAGVDIDVADATKREMAASLEPSDPRVLNRVGAFASLFSAEFPGITDPVLVLKMEEPGTKQKLAFTGPPEKGWVRSICFDMINHLINDIAVMGATPLAVQDAIICGKLEQHTVGDLVRGIADACRAQGCSLVGGETSEQPGVLAPGIYVLTASIVGVVDRGSIIDGSKISDGDVVLGVGSNGLHTNGYSLVRALLDSHKTLAASKVGEGTFMDAIMAPHLCYYPALKDLFPRKVFNGLAHITGGGIEGNLSRIIPAGLCADIELSQIPMLEVFSSIREVGALSQEEMLKTFNCGVGLVAVVEQKALAPTVAAITAHGLSAFPLGTIRRRASSEASVALRGQLA